VTLLEGKRTIVVGGSSGIGTERVRAFASKVESIATRMIALGGRWANPKTRRT
jgi:hypothetical protein